MWDRSSRGGRCKERSRCTLSIQSVVHHQLCGKHSGLVVQRYFTPPPPTFQSLTNVTILAHGFSRDWEHVNVQLFIFRLRTSEALEVSGGRPNLIVRHNKPETRCSLLLSSPAKSKVCLPQYSALVQVVLFIKCHSLVCLHPSSLASRVST